MLQKSFKRQIYEILQNHFYKFIDIVLKKKEGKKDRQSGGAVLFPPIILGDWSWDVAFFFMTRADLRDV